MKAKKEEILKAHAYRRAIKEFQVEQKRKRYNINNVDK